ncbi:hypothetical protein SYNPS1DRAFT_31881 [Syncephalis pseudoplumigaleata]|uniref:Uncharacterized protein n=1 Tax=Syncephalis pseudoplumigaleata TaxID=1712513 RepID=A0A4P9YRQ2_9FUNG|nr:hypothetical protein SYNPS1DRAFT_31881 [Syncephalis pseudoplumigaleata]|eukprot:RKP22517.1 hypothetical protein SYNPS1DRAFT_31881 [Syncephalis pseudoplumigaleata]
MATIIAMPSHSPAASRKLFDKLPADMDKEYVLLEGEYHEVHNEQTTTAARLTMPLNIDALRKELANMPPFHEPPATSTAANDEKAQAVQQVKACIKEGVAQDTARDAATTAAANEASRNTATSTASTTQPGQ